MTDLTHQDLDALIAVNLMGYRRKDNNGMPGWVLGDSCEFVRLPEFTTDRNAAALVLAQIDKNEYLRDCVLESLSAATTISTEYDFWWWLLRMPSRQLMEAAYKAWEQSQP